MPGYPLLCAESRFQSRFLILFLKMTASDRRPNLPQTALLIPGGRVPRWDGNGTRLARRLALPGSCNLLRTTSMPLNCRIDDRPERSHRRSFLAQLGVGSATVLAAGVAGAAPPAQQPRPPSNQSSTRTNPIGVSTYSFWQFRERRTAAHDRGVHRQGRGPGIRRRGDPARSNGGRVECHASKDSNARPTRWGWP